MTDHEERPAPGRHRADRRATSPAPETEPTRTSAQSRGPDQGKPGTDQGKPGADQGKRREHLPFWQEMALLLVVALVLAVGIKALFMQAFYIPSGSMNDTLVFNDRILVQKVSYWGGGTPQRGDIVVFSDPGGWLDEQQVPQARNPVAKVLETFGPAGDDFVEFEFDRFTAFHRAVEHGAIDQLAGVMHAHGVARRRLRARAGILNLVAETSRGLHDVLVFLQLGEEGERVGHVLLAELRHVRLALGLERTRLLRHERLELGLHRLRVEVGLAAGAAAGVEAAGLAGVETPGTLNLTASSAEAATSRPRLARAALTWEVNFIAGGKARLGNGPGGFVP